MKSGIFSLRRLRWKLTFSYTLVTVVALLALELILASAVVAFLNSELPPRLIVQLLKDDLAPRLEAPLSGKTPDPNDIRAELRKPVVGSDAQGTGITLSGSANDPTTVLLFVVDDKRKLLVAEPELREFPEKERFAAGRYKGLTPLLDAALNGEENSGKLSANVDGRVLMVTPVADKNGGVAGAVVGTFKMPNLTGPLLVTVGISATLLMIPAALLGTLVGFLTAWGITRRLQRLARAAQSWSRGDFSVTTRDRSKDELGQLSRELNSMAAQLENLLQARGELATLEARNRFARDLHDSVKQQVFATSLQIAAARNLIQRDTDAAESHLSQADELVRQAQKELNVLIQEMRPAALEGKGLAAALREYAARWSQGAEIPAEFHVRGEREASLEIEQALFRVAQEALANVAKHSGAGKAEVDLTYTMGDLTLRISDDGRGFEPRQSAGGGFGLESMRERLVRLGGQVNVESAIGKGTRITCICPLDGAKKEYGA